MGWRLYNVVIVTVQEMMMFDDFDTQVTAEEFYQDWEYDLSLIDDTVPTGYEVNDGFEDIPF